MKTGIVLEGGGSRGVFTSGVLDVMMERGLRFDYCVGVSAGAGNAMHLKSRQPGRTMRVLTQMKEPYYGLSQARSSRKLLDLDAVYERTSYDPADPFDFAAYYSDPMECEYVAACCETAEPEYLSEAVHRKRLLACVKASCSIPGLCAPVALDGRHYLDGGVADALPVHRALERGCERVVLVTTKPAANLHPTDYSRLKPIMAKLYRRRYPEFFRLLMARRERYFLQLGRILELEEQGRIYVIRPEECGVQMLEKDPQKLREYYQHGREVAENCWEALSEYLEKAEE